MGPNENSGDLPSWLKKEFQDKQLYAQAYFDLLIYLIREKAFIQYQVLNEPDQGAERKEFEKNINHALTLLAAAKKTFSEQGPSSYTDYLITSALAKVTKYLPEQSVKEITEKLNSFNENTSSFNKQTTTGNSSSKHSEPSNKTSTQNSEATSKLNTQKIKQVKKSESVSTNIQNLTVSVTPLLSSKESKSAAVVNRVVIDFAADELPFLVYGEKVANRLGAALIQVQPDQFSALNANFSISKNTTLTLMGHCCNGSNHLSDNSGRRIYASQIAEQIYAKMMQNNTAPNTEFTIDLIACQAASRNGNHLSFAERLVNELAKRGINNVNVIASPTIMTTTSDGKQANLTRHEDQKTTARLEGREHQQTNSGFFSDISSSFNSIFSSSKINVEKVTFRSNSNNKKPSVGN